MAVSQYVESCIGGADDGDALGNKKVSLVEYLMGVSRQVLAVTPCFASDLALRNWVEWRLMPV